MSPYALARKSYFVNDNLAYEAQVIAAIVLARAPLSERPDISYSGEGTKRRCKVVYTFLDGAVREYQSPEIGSITPKNSPLWKSDPDQQLAYYSLRAGARRHCPDVILGIYDADEMAALKARDVTPARTPLSQRLAAPRAERGTGFSPEFVSAELKESIDADTGEITDIPDRDGAPQPANSGAVDGEADGYGAPTQEADHEAAGGKAAGDASAGTKASPRPAEDQHEQNVSIGREDGSSADAPSSQSDLMSPDEVLMSFEAELAEAESVARVEEISASWADEINRTRVGGRARAVKSARVSEIKQGAE
nr:recombinase RecT [Acuticoccus kalidii]